MPRRTYGPSHPRPEPISPKRLAAVIRDVARVQKQRKGIT